MFFIAFVIVLALIGLVTWLVRRFAGNRLGNGANRGRLPRLAVIDAAAVDGRRRLVLVRRDNIEHLLMIGGPTDIVVEQNIVRATPAREGLPGRGPSAEPQWSDEPAMRPEPLDYVEPTPLPEPVARPVRTAFPDEPRRPAPPERREPTAFAPEPMVRNEASLAPRDPSPRESAARDVLRPTFRAEPTIPRPARSGETGRSGSTAAPAVRAERTGPSSAAAVAADKNLAEMAQRLEAALRRPGAPAAAAPERGAAASAAPDPSPAKAADPAPRAASEPADKPRPAFKDLEDEMASLLGRPKSPS